MVILNFKYTDFKRLNTFNNLDKNRYLPYFNKFTGKKKKDQVMNFNKNV